MTAPAFSRDIAENNEKLSATIHSLSLAGNYARLRQRLQVTRLLMAPEAVAPMIGEEIGGRGSTSAFWPITALCRGSECQWSSRARSGLAKTLTGIFDPLLRRRSRWNANPGRG